MNPVGSEVPIMEASDCPQSDITMMSIIGSNDYVHVVGDSDTNIAE